MVLSNADELLFEEIYNGSNNMLQYMEALGQTYDSDMGLIYNIFILYREYKNDYSRILKQLKFPLTLIQLKNITALFYDANGMLQNEFKNMIYFESMNGERSTLVYMKNTADYEAFVSQYSSNN